MTRMIVFYFLLYTVLSVTFQFLPVYFGHRGLTTMQIGMLTGAGSLISIFANPIWGYICDKRNHVKPVLLFLLVMCILTSIGLYSVGSFPLLMVFMLMLMFFQGPAPALLDSMAVTNIPNYGAVRMWGSAGLAAAAFVIGHLTGWFGIGYLWIIYAVAAAAAIGAAYSLKDVQRRQAGITIRSLRQVFGNKRLLWFLLLAFLVAVPNRMNENMLSLFLARMGASDAQIGLSWTTATLAAVPVYAISDLLLRGKRELEMLTAAAFLFSLRWLLYGLLASPAAMPYLQLLNGVTFPLFFVAAVRYVAAVVPEELGAIGQTTYAAVFAGLGGIVGSIAGGWAMDHVALHVVYLGACIPSLLGTIGFGATILYRKGKKHNENGAYRDSARQQGA